MDKPISMLQSLLPDPLPRWILGLSIPISGFLLLWPSYDLPAKYLSDTEVTKLLLRIVSAGTPLLICFALLTILLAYHNKKISAQKAELKSTLDIVSTDAQENSKTVKSLQAQLAITAQERDTLKKQNSEYFYQVSSLNTDKNTLRTLLDEQDKKHLAAIEQLTTSANTFRDEARQIRTHATEIQKELTSLKTEYNDLKQRNAGTESLAIMRGRKLEQCEKELEEIKKSPPPSIHPGVL